VRRRDLVDSDVPPKLQATLGSASLGGLLPTGEPLDFFEPRLEVVRIDGGTPGLAVWDPAPAGYGSGAANPADAKSLCWVPPLARFSQQARFERGLLGLDGSGQQVVPASSRLAGTFVIDRGRLAGAGVIENAAQPVEYEFRRLGQAEGQGSWRQSLAEAYQLEVSLAQADSALVFENEAGDKRRVHLRGQDVEIWVIERELEEILGFTALHEATGPAGQGDEDFTVFYRLTAGWSAAQAAEIRIPFVTTAGGGGRNKPCGAARFAN
jgi:hypothetical protein